MKKTQFLILGGREVEEVRVTELFLGKLQGVGMAKSRWRLTHGGSDGPHIKNLESYPKVDGTI